MNRINCASIIQSRLMEAFSPSHLEVIDESDQHIGHAGHQGGGKHFAIIIAAAPLVTLTRVAAHQQIYNLFNDMIPNQIHALKIKVINPLPLS